MTMAGDFTFTLPGAWSRIDVRDPETAMRDVRRLVDRIVPRRDDAAEMRRQLRDQLQKSVDGAVAASASDLYFAHEILRGIPLPASLVVSRPEIRALGLMQGQPEHNKALISTTVDQLSGADPYEDPADFVVGSAGVARRSRVRPGRGEGDRGSLDVTYWIAAPSVKGIVVMAFTSGMPELRSSLTELFDAIVSSIVWSAGDAPADSPEPSAEDATRA